jgi:hypothetical protein
MEAEEMMTPEKHIESIDDKIEEDKIERAKKEWTKHIVFFAKRIYDSTYIIKDREDWESEVSEYLEMISDEIVEELEIMVDVP